MNDKEVEGWVNPILVFHMFEGELGISEGGCNLQLGTNLIRTPTHI